MGDRSTILIDLLGSGFSERPADFDYSIDAHARSVYELVQHLGIDRVSVFGHSMGGAVAIALVRLLGAQAERLVLSEPNLDPGGGSFSKRIAAMAEAEYVAWGHHETIEAARAEGNLVWAAAMAGTAPFAVHRSAASLVAGSDPTWRSMLYDLRLPRTVIFGERSLPHADFDGLPGRGIDIDVVRAAGHSMAWDNPAGLAVALRRALV